MNDVDLLVSLLAGAALAATGLIVAGLALDRPPFVFGGIAVAWLATLLEAAVNDGWRSR